jgi:hypothetical protein
MFFKIQLFLMENINILYKLQQISPKSVKVSCFLVKGVSYYIKIKKDNSALTIRDPVFSK